MIPLWVKAGGIGIVALAVFALYFRYEHMVGKVATLEIARAADQELIQDMRVQAAKIEQLQTAFSKDLAEARESTERTREIVAKHDLGRVASAKPVLVTKIMKQATVKVFKEIEDATNTTD